MAGSGGLPDRDQVNDAIADALSDWLDPDDDEGIDLLAQIDGLMTDDVLAAFASYHAEAEAASLRISASDEQKDLDAIRKDAVYLLEHDDPKRRILFMHRMQMFPPFAFAMLAEKHGVAFMDAADRLREYVDPADLATLAEALADTVEIPSFTKRSNIARNRLAERLEQLYRDRVYALRLEVWRRYVYGNEPAPPSAHAQFAEDVMRAMGIKFETKPAR